MKRAGVAYGCFAGLAAIAAFSGRAVTQPAGHPEAAASLRAAGMPRDVVATFERACLDCHSGDTHWPWYARLPLIREQIQADVAMARQFLDFSNWSKYTPGQRLGYAVAIGNAAGNSMPPRKYLAAHWSAIVADSEREHLQRWAKAERARLLESRARKPNTTPREPLAAR